MATEVALKLTADGSQASDSVKSIKQQLKEAQAEVVAMSDKFGATSAQAAQAARKAGELKDRIGDAKGLTDAFTPDKKFQAFAGALQGVIGGFQALQGAQALFGNQSKEVEEVMMKLQAAMALSQGLNAMSASIDSFKQLGSMIKNATIFQKGYEVATVAAAAVQRLFTGAVASTSVGFKALRAAIISTGIGALIIGITMMVQKIQEWTSGSEEAEKAQKDLNDAIDKQNKLLDQSLQALNFERQAFERRAKIQGLSQNQILNQQVNFNKQELDLLRNNYNVKSDLLKKAFVNENIQGEEYKKIRDEKFNAEKALTEAENKLKLSQLDVEAQVAEESRNNAKKNSDKAAQDAQKRNNESKQKAEQEAQKRKQQREQEQQQIEQDTKAAAEATKQLEDEIALQKIKDDDERAKAKLKQDYDNAVKDIEQSKATSEIKQKQLAALRQKFEFENADIDNKIKEKNRDKETKREEARLAATIAAFKDENQKKAFLIEVARDEEIQKQADAYNQGLIDLEKYNNAVAGINAEFDKQQTDLKKQISDKQLADEKAATDAKIKLAEEEKNAKLQAADETANSLSQLSQLVGEQTGVGKAMAVAAATISTTSAAIKAYERGVEVPFVGMALGPINAALAVAAGVANIRKILAVKVPNEKGTPPMPTNTQISAPLTPQIGTTTINQGQVNQLASATARAFVLESDVSGSQERIKRINRAARIN